MKSIDRLYDYFLIKGIKPTAFEKELGLSNGYLGTQKKRNADIGETILFKIIDYCRDLSLEWLLTGRGEMLKNTKESSNANEGTAPIEMLKLISHLDNRASEQDNTDQTMYITIPIEVWEEFKKKSEQIDRLISVIEYATK